MVSTQLKNISQNGNLRQVGLKMKNIWNHQLVSNQLIFYLRFPLSNHCNNSLQVTRSESKIWKTCRFSWWTWWIGFPTTTTYIYFFLDTCTWAILIRIGTLGGWLSMNCTSGGVKFFSSSNPKVGDHHMRKAHATKPGRYLAGPTRREWGKFHPQYTNVKVDSLIPY